MDNKYRLIGCNRTTAGDYVAMLWDGKQVWQGTITETDLVGVINTKVSNIRPLDLGLHEATRKAG